MQQRRRPATSVSRAARGEHDFFPLPRLFSIHQVGYIFTHDFAITADYVNEKMTEFYNEHKDDIAKHRTAAASASDE